MTPLIYHKKITPVFYLAFALFTFACFAFSPTAQATPDPASVGGVFNTADGFNAMPSMSAGTANSAFGSFALFSAVSANFNTAVGAGALLNNSADGNTAVGPATLFNNTTGKGNTAVGPAALLSNTNGIGNTAVGAQALLSNIGDDMSGVLPKGFFNTAVGLNALFSNTTGSGNTAMGGGLEQPMGNSLGLAPLASNTTGNLNTAIGGTRGDDPAALGSNTTGRFNTAVGANSAPLNTSGEDNTAVGVNALRQNTTGNNNIAVGSGAGQSLTTGNENIDIGNGGQPDEANTIHIGTPFNEPSKTGQNKTFIAGIFGTTITGSQVGVTSDGQLGVLATSSARFKDEIKPMDKASEAILALKPVTFHYKKEIDPKSTAQFGLVAEEVEKVNPDLVTRDNKGALYTVRYDAVNAMLLNEFLKEHRKVQEQGAIISRLQKQVEALTAGLQKVSAQLELQKPSAQTVVDNQ